MSRTNELLNSSTRGSYLPNRYVLQMFPKKGQRPGPACGIGWPLPYSLAAQESTVKLALDLDEPPLWKYTNIERRDDTK